MADRVRSCAYSDVPHAHVGDCCEPGFEAGYAPPPEAYGPHPEDQPTPVSQSRLDAVRRLRDYLDSLDEQTRRPGEPPLREAVAAQARERLAEMDQPVIPAKNEATR